jgi:hypothetical protein
LVLNVPDPLGPQKRSAPGGQAAFKLGRSIHLQQAKRCIPMKQRASFRPGSSLSIQSSVARSASIDQDTGTIIHISNDLSRPNRGSASHRQHHDKRSAIEIPTQCGNRAKVLSVRANARRNAVIPAMNSRAGLYPGTASVSS